jgi:perosamine synthetase
MSLGAAESRVVQAAGLDVSDPTFKRHDVLGWNYRMPEFCAAIALAQLEKVTELVELRIKAAKQYDAILEETKCTFLQKQHVPDGWTHSYWCWPVRFLPGEANGVSHKEFRQLLKSAGASTVRAAWSVPYLEPLMSTGKFTERLPQIYHGLSSSEGLCPIAESLQRNIMQFKTSMRNDTEVNIEVEALRNAILSVQNH